MDGIRNRCGENARVRHISLPTLFEYGDTRRIEAWNTDKKIWFDLVKVTDTGEKSDGVSTLPNLTKKHHNLDLTTARDSLKPKTLEKIVENVRVDEDWLSTKNANEGRLDLIECGSEILENDEKIANCLHDGNGVKMKGALMKKSNFNRKNCASGDKDFYGEGKAKEEKMNTVREWIQDQAQLNFIPKSRQIEVNAEEKLPAMPLNMSRKKPHRVRSISEDSWRANEVKYDLSGKEMPRAGNGEGKSELSSRLFETRQRKKTAVLANEPIATCDSIGMNDITQGQFDTTNTKQKKAAQKSARRSCTPFPLETLPRENSLLCENRNQRRSPVSVAVPKGQLTSCTLDISPRCSSAFSWPVSSQVKRDNVAGITSGRRRPLTPKPPALLLRTKSTDL